MTPAALPAARLIATTLYVSARGDAVIEPRAPAAPLWGRCFARRGLARASLVVAMRGE